MQAEQLYYSPEEYLELEEAAGDRHEYIDGQIILMSGGFPKSYCQMWCMKKN
jgi:Uma2 family endonuclease